MSLILILIDELCEPFDNFGVCCVQVLNLMRIVGKVIELACYAPRNGFHLARGIKQRTISLAGLSEVMPNKSLRIASKILDERLGDYVRTVSLILARMPVVSSLRSRSRDLHEFCLI
jgi:hypothetical protein